MRRTIPTLLCLLAALLVPAAAHAATAPTAAFAKSSDWGTGYEAKYTITAGDSALNGWKVEFDLPSGGSVGSYWDALMTQSGSHYTFTNRDYNAQVPAGGSVSFGFIGSPSSAVPANCKLNGQPCTGGGGSSDTTAPSTPAGLSVTGTTAGSISLSWTASTDNVGVAGYKVYEGSSVVANVSSASATVGGLAASSTHTYQVSAYDAAGNESAKSGSVTATTQQGGGGGSPGAMAAAPYLYFGWGSPPDPTTVMSATGVKWFTLAFVLSDGGCNPAWDGTRPLNGDDATKIQQIRAAGGDVIPSFGGWSGNKLGEHCSTAQDLAGAYQKVINAYSLKAIDIDMESTEFESEANQDRVLQALKIIKQNNSGVKVILTFGTTTSGPNWWGTRLVQQAAALGVPIDTFTIMPFDFGGGSGNMGQLSIQASEGLHGVLKQNYPGKTDAELYAMQGISSMNGNTDQSETVTTADFQTMRSYAQQHGLSRFTFWSVNRDRPCGSGTGSDACSGVSQQPWDYTKIVAQYS
ncbi:cellulose binding domain-containing protein [Actinoallomurus vinaceus]|uniref:Cellulose binding domain-containing protein n=1 Tax=Actinoallomurus vinaceus TaxID=1080074 RepID=A0ABP8UM58_9ACTN